MADAVYKDGVVVLGEKVDWQDGEKLLVLPQSATNQPTLRGNRKPWPVTPEELGEFLDEMDSLGSMMNESEAADFERSLEERKRENDGPFDEHADKTEKLFS